MYHLNLVGDVDGKMVEAVLGLFAEIKNDDIETPIAIQLFTYGGEVYAGQAIYDLLKLIENPVYITAHGSCMSAGIVILMAADKRAATEGCQFLIHYGEEYTSSGTERKHNDNLTKRMINIIAKGSGKAKSTVNRWLQKETYLDSKQAISKGLIDRIIQNEE